MAPPESREWSRNQVLEAILGSKVYGTVVQTEDGTYIMQFAVLLLIIYLFISVGPDGPVWFPDGCLGPPRVPRGARRGDVTLFHHSFIPSLAFIIYVLLFFHSTTTFRFLSGSGVPVCALGHFDNHSFQQGSIRSFEYIPLFIIYFIYFYFIYIHYHFIIYLYSESICYSFCFSSNSSF